MTPFEYTSVLISIILGLGITQLVSGIADMVHRWDRVKLYWPHLLWIFFVFFLHIQDWWTLYELRNMEVWHLKTFLFTVIYPINLFILARILFPFNDHEEFNFKTFYYKNARKFFTVSLCLVIISLIDNWLILNQPITNQPMQLLLLVVFAVMVIINYKQEWIHQLIVAGLTILVIIALSLHEWVIKA